MRKVDTSSECYREGTEEIDASSLTEHIVSGDANNLNVNSTDCKQELASPISDPIVNIENTLTTCGDGNPIYYTSNLYDGVANVEEIADDYQQENEHDTESNSENEVDRATPIVSVDTHLNEHYDSFDNEALLLQYDQDIAEQWIDKSLNDSDIDSDEEELYHLLPDVSSDEEQLSVISPTFSEESYRGCPGNLPFFDKLNVNVTTDSKSSLIFQLASSQSRVASSRVIHGTSHVEDTLIKSDSKDIVKQTDEDNVYADKYCSTNVQSALLGKLNVDTCVDSELSESSTATTFKINIQAISDSIRRNIFPSRKKTSIKYKVETDTIGKSDVNSLETDLPIDLENVDSEVDKAFKDSVSEGSVLPLVKQELQYTIQVRRLSRGKPELILEPEQPKKYKV